MKRDATEMSLPGTGDDGESSQLPLSPKRNPPEVQLRKFWVEDLPPQGLGYGCTSAAFEVPACGIIDDIKQAIKSRLSHSRFALYKRHFRLTQNGQHKQYFEKISTLSTDVLLKFHWSAYSTENYRHPLEYRP